MVFVVVLRFAAYIASIVASVALVGRLLSARNRLSRLLAVVMAAWFVNSLILLSYLVWWAFTGESSAPWQEATMTVNALLMAGCPLALFWYFAGLDGKEP